MAERFEDVCDAAHGASLRSPDRGADARDHARGGGAEGRGALMDVQERIDSLRVELEKLDGKTDHFSLKERKRLEQRLGLLDARLATVHVAAEEAAAAPAQEEDEAAEEEQPKRTPRKVAHLHTPEMLAKVRAGKQRYWAERRAAKERGEEPKQKKKQRRPKPLTIEEAATDLGVQLPQEVADFGRHFEALAQRGPRPAPSAQVPAQPPPQHWEVYVGPPRDVEARRLREVLQRARGILGQQRYAGSWVDAVCRMLDESLTGGAS